MTFPLAEYLNSKPGRAERGMRSAASACKNPLTVCMSRLSIFPGAVDRDLLVCFPNFIHVAWASTTRRGRNFS